MDCSFEERPLDVGDAEFLFAPATKAGVAAGGWGAADDGSDTASLSTFPEDDHMHDISNNSESRRRRGSLELMLSRGSLSMSSGMNLDNQSFRSNNSNNSSNEFHPGVDSIREEQSPNPLKKFVDARWCTFSHNIDFVQEKAKHLVSELANRTSFTSSVSSLSTTDHLSDTEDEYPLPDLEGMEDDSSSTSSGHHENPLRKFVEARRNTFVHNMEFVQRQSSNIWTHGEGRDNIMGCNSSTIESVSSSIRRASAKFLY